MSEKNNSLQRRTPFVVLPNEVIYCIFDYLTSIDIVLAFAQVNHRYDDLVRSYVKRIDLTDGWYGDWEMFKWICDSIQTIKVDKYYVHYLNSSTDQMKVIPSHIKEKSLFRTIKEKLFTRSQKTTISSQYCLNQVSSAGNFRFSQLRSLHLVNICDWKMLISGMNLESLSIWFDSDQPYCWMSGPIISHWEDGSIPETVIRFSTNAMFGTKNFHTNLIDLNICVHSAVHLLQILENTPNLQHLFINFPVNSARYNHMNNNQSDCFKAMAINFCPLSSLSRLSFNVDVSDDSKKRFDDIQLFIDRCCPNQTILKIVTLKMVCVIFDEYMWSTIVRYKNTFDRFDFYGSFAEGDKASISRIISSTNDQFDFHIDVPHYSSLSVWDFPRAHIYSLPFGFDQLHGFSTCSELSPRCSYSGVRRLYLRNTYLNRPISFKSLSKCMPHLISIDCTLLIASDYNITASQLIDDRDIFNSVRFLRFLLYPHHENTDYNILPRLLDQMPHLQRLTALGDTFIYVQKPLPSIKRLDLRGCTSRSIDNLSQRLPLLSTLLLDYRVPRPKALSQLVGSLFIQIPTLKLLSFTDDRPYASYGTMYSQIVEKNLARMQKMDSRLCRLRLDCRNGLPKLTFRYM